MSHVGFDLRLKLRLRFPSSLPPAPLRGASRLCWRAIARLSVLSTMTAPATAPAAEGSDEGLPAGAERGSSDASPSKNSQSEAADGGEALAAEQRLAEVESSTPSDAASGDAAAKTRAEGADSSAGEAGKDAAPSFAGQKSASSTNNAAEAAAAQGTPLSSQVVELRSDNDRLLLEQQRLLQFLSNEKIARLAAERQSLAAAASAAAAEGRLKLQEGKLANAEALQRQLHAQLEEAREQISFLQQNLSAAKREAQAAASDAERATQLRREEEEVFRARFEGVHVSDPSAGGTDAVFVSLKLIALLLVWGVLCALEDARDFAERTRLSAAARRVRQRSS